MITKTQLDESTEALNTTTLCVAVTNRLRQDILSGVLIAGQKLDQTSIAERFGVSRMPIRDALRTLEGEGLVQIKPGRGSFVAMINLSEFVQIYQVREALESLAMQLAIPRISDEELSVLADCVNNMEKAGQQNNLGRWVDLDRSFHLGSYQDCQNPTLLKVIAGFWNATQHYRRVFISYPSKTDAALIHHKQLLEAFQDRDGKRAAKLMVAHIRATVRAILQNQDNKQETYFTIAYDKQDVPGSIVHEI